jgi:transposase
MRVNGASRNLHERLIQHAPFAGRNNQHFSALFEKQLKQINRLERENERLRRELDEAKKKLNQDENKLLRDEKRIAELEKENSKLKRDLEAKTLQSDKPDLLSTPSGMRPVYSKPPAGKRSRKPGRKNGHPGVRRTVPAHIDQTVEHKLTECPDCHNPLGEPCGRHTRIVEDTKPVLPAATEHVVYEYHCGRCGKKVSDPVTDALPRATIGLRLTLLSAFLHYALGMTTRNICTWLRTCCQFPVTPGGLVLQWQRLAEILKPVYDELATEARLSAVLNIDESGWRILGRTAWLWCFTNAQLAYYVLTSSRAGPVVKEVLGEGFNGIMITDFFAAYDRIQAFAKQRCVVHLLREIKQVSLHNRSSEWKRFARRLKRLIHEALKLMIDRERISEKEYDRWVANLHIRLADIFGISYRDADSKRLSKRLAKYSNELLTFLLHSKVSADNNHAERQIRFAVIMRKNYFGNRSMRGAETQAVLMSVFRTCHLRGIDPISFLADSVAAAIRSGSPLPIPNSSRTAKVG